MTRISITKERSKLNLWRKLYLRRRELDILPLVGVSPVCLCPCLGVWVWSWIIWIQSPLSALTWIPLTIAQWTLSLWPVTRSPGIIYETNSASENSPDKDRVDIIFHSHFRRIHSHFFYTAGRGGQLGDGDTRPIMEFLSSWLNPQLCSHFKPLPSLDPTYCIAVIR